MYLYERFTFAEEVDATYFTDAAVTTLGAILDRDECRKTIVCSACNAIKEMGEKYKKMLG